MPSIRVPSALRSFTGGASDVDVTAATVGDALAELDRRHPGFAAKVLANGAVKPFIRIFVGPDDIGGLAGLATKLAERDEVSIVPAIAGGREAAEPPESPESIDA
jgi:molybdopterin synthase sulfur carrier subunit